jgi:hypothetical protein
MPALLPVKAGRTPGPGIEDPLAGWRQYQGGSGPGIYIDVVAALSFTDPVYVASLSGNSTHWQTTGGNCVYPTPNRPLTEGFRVYVRFANGSAIDPQFAVDNGWRVSWIAMKDGLLLVP